MELDFSLVNDTEHYGREKIKLIGIINSVERSKGKEGFIEYPITTREDVILKRLAELYGVPINFHLTRKYSKRVLKKLVCCKGGYKSSLAELMYIEKNSPSHFEVKDLKSRIENTEYRELVGSAQKDLHCEHIITLALSKNFYSSSQWRAVRYQALRLYKNYCHCCGRHRSETLSLQVDHIKPRSISPELALDLSNLQILCTDCNQGKSNLDCTNWRD